MKSLVVTLICLFALSSIYAQRINLKPGEEFTITTHSTQSEIKSKKVTSDEAYSFQFKMLSSDAGICKLQCTLQKINQSISQQYPTRLVSDSIRKINDIGTTDFLPPLILLQQPFTVFLSSKGKLLKEEGIDELVKQAIAKWHVEASLQVEIKPSIDNFLTTTLKNMFFEMPEQKIAYLSDWTNADTKEKYKVIAIRGALLDIVLDNPEKNNAFKLSLNEVNGLPEQADVTFNQSQVPDTKKYTYSHSISYDKNTTEHVDTTWINMAVSLSFISDAFKNNKENTDSAKAFGYFKAHDALFKNDRYYMLKKLSLIQGIRSNQGHLTYDSLLIKTPNQLLAGQSSHLFNKLQTVLSIDADSAYNVIKYFYKDPQLTGWIQESYAQSFLNEDRPIANKLLLMLYSSKEMDLKPQLGGLYQWATTKSSINNPGALLKAYNYFMEMKDPYLKKGNGARYALLTYKMLQQAKKPKQAGNLLQKTIQNLERFNADTLNKNKFADRNILAYAYYLKYQSTVKTDSARALQYLAKASQYSPIGKNDRAYASFYDRVFLESQESYREEFIQKLFASGSSETALNIFASQVSADPTRIADLEQIYQNQFPGKSFKDFFATRVLDSWPAAPDFELTDVDGKKRKLADYKNKWLVIDFWGTWCSPCREEMPKINEFNNQLINDKNAGVNLLGIACYDNQIDVKKYLSNNNYNITVAISDNLVQHKYKVNGYPSKILISPTGKMVDVAFGADWQSVIEKFSELYAAN